MIYFLKTKKTALTNKGNCYFAEGDYDKAKHYYEDSLKIDASCVEALYNLGLIFSIFLVYKCKISLKKSFFGRSHLQQNRFTRTGIGSIF